MTSPNASRRDFLLAMGTLGLGAVAAACTGKSTPSPTPTGLPPDGGASTPPGGGTGSITAIEKGANAQLSVLSAASAEAPLAPGKQLFGFALTTSAGGLVTGGQPSVYLAKDQTSKPLGPFAADWFPFTGYEKTADTSPKSPIGGIYSLEVDLPSPGNWYLAAVAQNGAQQAVGVSVVPVTGKKLPNAVGSPATPVDTPVATTEAKLKQICTRQPPCHMHAISITDALKNGKPTVIVFSTPLLCESQLCGPVTDEQILVSQKYAGKGNFIHVEEFLPGRQLKPPAPTLENQAPGFKAWHLQSEPWIFVVGRTGRISARLGPGPVVAEQIEAELKRVL
jgi:hypothetical protein